MWQPEAFDDRRFADLIDMSLEYFGPDNDVCDTGFVRHQYFHNPFGDALIELAVDAKSGELAGQYVLQPQKFRCFGQEIPCVLSFNTLTREAYRGQKIFIGLAERAYKKAADEGYAFVYGCPNPNSYPGFTKKLAFKDIHHFPLYARPLNLFQMVEERTNSKVLAAIVRPFGVLFQNHGVNSSDIELLTEKNYRLMDGFWDKVKDKYPVMGVRDAQYIRYRYLDVPRRVYYPYVAIENGGITAFAVGRIREVAGFNAGMIADFLFLPGHEEQAKKVLKTLVKRMKDEGSSLAGCIILAHTEERRVLEKCGFYHVPDKMLPQPTPLIFRLLDKSSGEAGLLDIGNWFFTAGDYDVV